jgi:NAD(P)-dependent dehydrogenase (short-subunit alcohol dehydrogenase family)
VGFLEGKTGLVEGKIGLVTGSGMGIGRAIARTMAREGAKVVVADINREQGEETVALIAAAGGTALFVAADMTEEEQVRAMVAAAVDAWGRLDVACNSAALSRGHGPLHEFERSMFDHTMEFCLTNTWLCMKHEIAAMLKTGGGAIVNISSNSSLRGQAYNTPYATAKAGVNILTKSAAAEYGALGIRINAVSPGVIRTPGVERYFQEQPQVVEQMKAAAVLGRLGEPEEIAEAVVFLNSDRASFITGQVLSVDGGGAVK